jgi:MGT family glycosyltransferase
VPRALFLGLPLAGHTNPTIGLVRELVARGEEVTYFTSTEHADAIGRAGARVQVYRGDGLTSLSALPAIADEMATWAMRTTAHVLEANLVAFRTARADYIIGDSVAPWAQWASRILSVPLVTSITTMAFNRKVVAYGVARGVRPQSASRFAAKLRNIGTAWRQHRQLCRRLGVSGPGVMASVMGSSNLNIVYTSRQFQPCADSFDSRFLFVGPSIDRIESEPPPPASSTPLVYVSLGTLFNAQLPFYRACFEAFAGEPLHVVMSVGSNVDVRDLGEPPANVVVAPRVPQLATLARARAFVTHGGMNSVSESLWFGVPMVVVPQMGEQMFVGRRVEDVGAGLYADRSQVTAAVLRASIRRLLTEPAFRQKAQAIGHTLRDAGGVGRAADAILAFTKQPSAS